MWGLRLPAAMICMKMRMFHSTAIPSNGDRLSMTNSAKNCRRLEDCRGHATTADIYLISNRRLAMQAHEMTTVQILAGPDEREITCLGSA